MPPTLELIPYTPDLAHHFSKINEEWITEMFVLEDSERIYGLGTERLISKFSSGSSA